MKLRFPLYMMIIVPVQIWAVGFVYTGVGTKRLELMEMTSVSVDVQIQERLAITRTDQIFTNHSNSEVEGIYEFGLPPGAVITDLVLWIEGKPVQGMILEKEQARQTYIDIVGRVEDPALIEQLSADRFRLSIFPFPQQGSRRVELEYMEVLETDSGTLSYRFPLAPETDQPLVIETFILRASIHSQHPFAVTTPEFFRPLTQIQQVDTLSADIFFSDEQLTPERDFELTITETAETSEPTVLSFAPQGDTLGYYALWWPLDPLQTSGPAEPLPRSVTFLLDVSSSMLGGKLATVKTALVNALHQLQQDDLFNVIAFSDTAIAFGASPVEATQANREEAERFIRNRRATGLTNIEAPVQKALEQAVPQGRLNHIILLTDGHHSEDITHLVRLRQQVEENGASGTRLYAVGVEGDVDRSLLNALTDVYGGSAHFFSQANDITLTLEDLFAEFAHPAVRLTNLEFSGVETAEVFPPLVRLATGGEEISQVGRYQAGGDFSLAVISEPAGNGWSTDDALNFTRDDTSLQFVPRLWAHRKIQTIEEQIAFFGPQKELLDGILHLGLRYRLVTRMTSLFAPDESVKIDPQVREESLEHTTAIEETETTAAWFGKTFYWRNKIWIDREFHPGLEIKEYRAAADQPESLNEFAQLNQDMIVVASGQAYRMYQGTRPVSPVLGQNAPNPFNSSTLIRYQVPAATTANGLHLVIYNLLGQKVRVLTTDKVQIGENQFHWDGKNERGHEVPSGVYLYRLEGQYRSTSRRMILVR